MLATRLLLLAGVAPLLCGFAPADKRARDLLQKGMGPGFGVNIVATLVQRDASGNGAYQTLRVERSKSGKVRVTVLQPARVAGTVSVDDGVRTRAYLPGQRVLLDQVSALQERQSPRERMDLAERNYTLTIGGKRRIAGRDAVLVIAKPRHPGIDERRYTLDAKTGFPLRLDTISPSGGSTMVFEVRDVSYPKALHPTTFEVRPSNEVKYVMYPRPKYVSEESEARRTMGFQPRVPSRLPLGFQVQRMYVDTSREWKRFAVRVGDGLVFAVVYQWVPEGASQLIRPAVQANSVEVNGIWMMAASNDLSAAAKDRLLSAFVGRSLDLTPTVDVVILP